MLAVKLVLNSGVGVYRVSLRCSKGGLAAKKKKTHYKKVKTNRNSCQIFDDTSGIMFLSGSKREWLNACRISVELSL